MSEDDVCYAIIMLNAFLSSGGRSCDEVRELGKIYGISRGELKRARKEIGVYAYRVDGVWHWDVHDENRAGYGKEWGF